LVLSHLLKQKTKGFGFRLSKGLAINAYLNALRSFGLRTNCRDCLVLNQTLV